MATLNPIILIPARMASSRLPGKPLADIGGRPMIQHVWERAVAAGVGPVVVAAAEAEIRDAIVGAGGTAVLTDPALPSGSDRVHAALATVDPDGRHNVVVNLQGDIPGLDPALIAAVLAALDDGGADIGTLVAPLTEAADRLSPDVVKAVVALASGSGGSMPTDGSQPLAQSNDQINRLVDRPKARPGTERACRSTSVGPALYFSRAPVPWGDGPFYHHIGIYAFRRPALARFVALPPGVLERRERLEQLRALENGMRIAAALVDAVPLSVDTPADLARARAALGASALPAGAVPDRS